MFRDEEGTDFLERKTVKVSQTDAYLYLFALRYMNYRVALVSWSEMPMGCEDRRMSKPLCKRFPPSSPNELVFSFVIVAFFICFCNTVQAKNVCPFGERWRTFKVNVDNFRVSSKTKPVPDFTVIHLQIFYWGTLHFVPLTKAKLSSRREHSSFSSTATLITCHAFAEKHSRVGWGFFFLSFQLQSTPLVLLCHDRIVFARPVHVPPGRAGSLVGLMLMVQLAQSFISMQHFTLKCSH